MHNRKRAAAGNGGEGPRSITFYDNVETSTDGVSWNAGTRAMGTVGTRDYILITVNSREPFAGGSITIPTGVTVGGVSCTLIAGQAQPQGGGTLGSSLWIVAAPATTTANVTVTWGFTQSRAGIGVHGLVSGSSTPLYSGTSTQAVASGDITTSGMTTSEVGLYTACVAASAASVAVVFTGTGGTATETVDAPMESLTRNTAAIVGVGTTQVALTSTNDGNACAAWATW